MKYILLAAFSVASPLSSLSFTPSAPFLPYTQNTHNRKSTSSQRLSSEQPIDIETAPSPTPDPSQEIRTVTKNKLLSLASRTKRGFSASDSDRTDAKELIETLRSYNPTPEPLSPFYPDSPFSAAADQEQITLAGKWTLVYTDAPDITSLDAGGPFSTAKLGRIGQECNPPFIKNVIEWKRPEWAKSLPFSGSDDSRVLQKVVCEAESSKDDPLVMDLKLVGIDLEGFSGGEEEDTGSDDNGFLSKVVGGGGPGILFQENPVNLRGPLKAPFGKFTCLYLDDEMRIIKTYQNYIAVNIRGEEWF